MTKGPRRLVLDQYLDSAREGSLTHAGQDWKNKATDLNTLGEALKKAAEQAELRIGEQTLTGPALRAGMEESSTSMVTKSEQLRAAGEALVQVGQQISDTRDARDSFKDLGEKPSAYQPPAGTPGVEPTEDELAAQAAASQARQGERTAWQTEYDKQEAKSLALTKQMDAAFLGAIPPMKEIHGQEDPTEPPPNVPSGPSGPYLPGTQAPIPTGGGGGGNDDGGGKPTGGGHDGGNDGGERTARTTTSPSPRPPSSRPPTTVDDHHHDARPHRGADLHGHRHLAERRHLPAHGSARLGSCRVGRLVGRRLGRRPRRGRWCGRPRRGAIRPGAIPTSGASGSTPVRAIGSTGRAGSAGALSRSAGSSAAARSAGSTGSPASRSAGSAGRGASTGSSAGRGGAGSRGAAGSSSGSRSGGRGSSGARSGGTGTSGSRGGRKGERDTTTDRDSLVYDQDWLGDDDIAPGPRSSLVRGPPSSGDDGRDRHRGVRRQVEERGRTSPRDQLGPQCGDHGAVVGAQPRARDADPDAVRRRRAPRPSPAAGCWRPHRRR